MSRVYEIEYVIDGYERSIRSFKATVELDVLEILINSEKYNVVEIITIIQDD